MYCKWCILATYRCWHVSRQSQRRRAIICGFPFNELMNEYSRSRWQRSHNHQSRKRGAFALFLAPNRPGACCDITLCMAVMLLMRTSWRDLRSHGDWDRIKLMRITQNHAPQGIGPAPLICISVLKGPRECSFSHLWNYLNHPSHLVTLCRRVASDPWRQPW